LRRRNYKKKLEEEKIMDIKLSPKFALCLVFTLLALAVGCMNIPTSPPAPILKASPAPSTSNTATPTKTITETPTATTTITPSGTPSPGTPTPTPSPTPVLVWWGGTIIYQNEFSSIVASSYLYLQANGQALTNATVYLTGGGLSTPVTEVYEGTPVTESGQPYAQYIAGLPSYDGGGVYTMTSVTSVGTASDSVTAPGGSMTVTSNGSQASWSANGSSGILFVLSAPNGGGTEIYQSPNTITSPFNIPATVYSAPGTYSVEIQLLNSSPPPVGASGAGINCLAVYSQNVTIP
jgi:hypothetical protein